MDHLFTYGQTLPISSHIQGPEILIDNTALDAWKYGNLANAEELLTAAIRTSHDSVHHLLASRALIRGRLRQWDETLGDAEQVLDGICVLTYIMLT